MSDWTKAWQAILGLSVGLSDESSASWTAVFVVMILFGAVVLPALAALALLERKFNAAIQSRIGPRRIGTKGIQQGMADFLKLLQKGSSITLNPQEDFWLAAVMGSVFMTLAFLPLGSLWLISDTEMSAILPIWISIVVALATLMLGVSCGTVPSVLGGLRQVSQTVAASLPSLIAILSVGLRSGGFRWSQVVASQGASPLEWNLFADPFQWISFLVFLSCGPLIMGFRPMDSASSLVDIGRGVSGHLYGMRFWFFRVREFYGVFLWAVIAVVLFCGAWNLPEGLHEALHTKNEPLFLLLIETGVLLLKASAIILLFYWFSASNPKARSDQLTDFGWRVLSPLSLVSLAGSILWMSWRGAS